MEKQTTPLDSFKEAYSETKDFLERLPSLLEKLISYGETIKEENSNLKKELDTIQSELDSHKQHYGEVEEQMQKFREMYEEIAQEQAEELDIKKLLSIYSILFEQVFAANPHTKILLLLQSSSKKVWTRDELTKTTGFSPAAVLKSLHDLRNNNLIDLDEETNEIRLIEKLA